MSFKGLPAECVWIVVYPLVVPNTPDKVLFASMLAASTGPAAVAVAALALGAPVADSPMVVAVYFLSSNYMCAALAYVIARIVHHYNQRLRHAREIGSYELIERLGEGGMGQVWRARHRLLARPAAIKLIRGELLGTDDRVRDAAMRRFEREAQATATLGSTHTVNVYDFGVTQDGDFYYVMELLNGMSLERFVQQHGPMEPSRAVYVLQQVCHSLGEAHARGMIHRDIKPANIFLCRLGPDDDFVKVLDFGLVKQVDGPAPGSMLTVETATPGTPAYMAPEIALGRQAIDGRADLYSLGCVAYFLLTGRPVFSGDTAMATALAHVKDVPVPPSARSEFSITPALDAVVMACLAKEPVDRPASANDLATRLSQSIPGTVWSASAAHAWWNLHRGASERLEGPGDPVLAPDAPREVCQLRCWPQFDRTPMRDRIPSDVGVGS
jgi:serine/threonine-protein kinase